MKEFLTGDHVNVGVVGGAGLYVSFIVLGAIVENLAFANLRDYIVFACIDSEPHSARLVPVIGADCWMLRWSDIPGTSLIIRDDKFIVVRSNVRKNVQV